MEYKYPILPKLTIRILLYGHFIQVTQEAHIYFILYMLNALILLLSYIVNVSDIDISRQGEIVI